MATEKSGRPQMSLQVPGQSPLRPNCVRTNSNGEFDPCRNAKITSPFYLYNHDSPRPSQDIKAGLPIHINVTDLEAQSTHSRSSSQDKEHSPSTDSGKVRLWSWRNSGRCMTKPQRSWFKELPRWQKMLIKFLIAFLLIGLIVGVAVGISVKVHGGIWKGDNQTHPIGG